MTSVLLWHNHRDPDVWERLTSPVTNTPLTQAILDTFQQRRSSARVVKVSGSTFTSPVTAAASTFTTEVLAAVSVSVHVSPILFAPRPADSRTVRALLLVCKLPSVLQRPLKASAPLRSPSGRDTAYLAYPRGGVAADSAGGRHNPQSPPLPQHHPSARNPPGNHSQAANGSVPGNLLGGSTCPGESSMALTAAAGAGVGPRSGHGLLPPALGGDDVHQAAAAAAAAAHRQRDSMVAAHLPAVITVFTLDGQVLHQNPASAQYLGHLPSVRWPTTPMPLPAGASGVEAPVVGAREGHLGPYGSAAAGGDLYGGYALEEGDGGSSLGVLGLVFEYEQAKLRQMMEVLSGPGSVWQGIVRVPTSSALKSKLVYSRTSHRGGGGGGSLGLSPGLESQATGGRPSDEQALAEGGRERDPDSPKAGHQPKHRIHSPRAGRRSNVVGALTALLPATSHSASRSNSQLQAEPRPTQHPQPHSQHQHQQQAGAGSPARSEPGELQSSANALLTERGSSGAGAAGGWSSLVSEHRQILEAEGDPGMALSTSAVAPSLGLQRSRLSTTTMAADCTEQLGPGVAEAEAEDAAPFEGQFSTGGPGAGSVDGGGAGGELDGLVALAGRPQAYEAEVDPLATSTWTVLADRSAARAGTSYRASTGVLGGALRARRRAKHSTPRRCTAADPTSAPGALGLTRRYSSSGAATCAADPSQQPLLDRRSLPHAVSTARHTHADTHARTRDLHGALKACSRHTAPTLTGLGSAFLPDPASAGPQALGRTLSAGRVAPARGTAPGVLTVPKAGAQGPRGALASRPLGGGQQSPRHPQPLQVQVHVALQEGAEAVTSAACSPRSDRQSVRGSAGREDEAPGADGAGPDGCEGPDGGGPAGSGTRRPDLAAAAGGGGGGGGGGSMSRGLMFASSLRGAPFPAAASGGLHGAAAAGGSASPVGAASPPPRRSAAGGGGGGGGASRWAPTTPSPRVSLAAAVRPMSAGAAAGWAPSSPPAGAAPASLSDKLPALALASLMHARRSIWSHGAPSAPPPIQVARGPERASAGGAAAAVAAAAAKGRAPVAAAGGAGDGADTEDFPEAAASMPTGWSANNMTTGAGTRAGRPGELGNAGRVLKPPAAAMAAAATGTAAGGPAAAAPSGRPGTAAEIVRPQSNEEAGGDGGAAEQDDGSYDTWHEISAVRAKDPVTRATVLVVTQVDVTAKVRAERHLVHVMCAERRLLLQLFPRHVLQHVVDANPLLNSGGGPLDSLPREWLDGGDWRPVLRDCDKLATLHPQATVLFADIAGFDDICMELPPQKVFAFLNDLFAKFDSSIEPFGVHKMETIGGLFIVAGGLLREEEDGAVAVRERWDPLHAEKVYMFAKAMINVAAKTQLPTMEEPVKLRIGIHTGPVMSGIVGTRVPRFVLFGDTVNTASRMQTSCTPGTVHVSEETRALLPHEDWTPTGGIQIRGKGLLNTYVWAPEEPMPYLSPAKSSTHNDGSSSADADGGPTNGGGRPSAAHMSTATGLPLSVLETASCTSSDVFLAQQLSFTAIGGPRRAMSRLRNEGGYL